MNPLFQFAGNVLMGVGLMLIWAVCIAYLSAWIKGATGGPTPQPRPAGPAPKKSAGRDFRYRPESSDGAPWL